MAMDYLVDYLVAVHFPDGRIRQDVDFNFAMAYMRIGEIFAIEGQQRYRIKDIQHQFREEPGQGLRMIMTNIILAGVENA